MAVDPDAKALIDALTQRVADLEDGVLAPAFDIDVLTTQVASRLVVRSVSSTDTGQNVAATPTPTPAPAGAITIGGVVQPEIDQ